MRSAGKGGREGSEWHEGRGVDMKTELTEQEAALLAAQPLQLSLTLASRDEMRAVLKAYGSGWRALTAREVLLCQDVINRLALEIWRRAEAGDNDRGRPLSLPGD